MPNTTEYNGWPNYETWLASLWMTNSEASYQSLTELADEVYASTESGEYINRIESAVIKLADMLAANFEDLAIEACPDGLLADLLGHSLRQVHWGSVAKEFIVQASERKESSRDQAGV